MYFVDKTVPFSRARDLLRRRGYTRKMMYTVVEELKSLDVRINAALKYTSTSTAMSNIFDRSADIDRIPKNIAEPVRYLASVGLP